MGIGYKNHQWKALEIREQTRQKLTCQNWEDDSCRTEDGGFDTYVSSFSSLVFLFYFFLFTKALPCAVHKTLACLF